MQRIIVQVPMSKELKEKAEIVSTNMGFSSIQETIRVLLTKLSKKEFSLKVMEAEKITYLSPAAERKFKKAVADIRAGRNVTKTNNIDELLSLLNA